MPQDELFRTRKAHTLQLGITSDPLRPHLPWKATLLIKDQHGAVMESATTGLPPVWEAEAFADIAQHVAVRYVSSSPLSAFLAFKRAAKAWRTAADQLLTGGQP